FARRLAYDGVAVGEGRIGDHRPDRRIFLHRHERATSAQRLADHGDARAVDTRLHRGEIDRGEDVPRLLDPERGARPAPFAVSPKVEEQDRVAVREEHPDDAVGAEGGVDTVTTTAVEQHGGATRT